MVWDSLNVSVPVLLGRSLIDGTLLALSFADLGSVAFGYEPAATHVRRWDEPLLATVRRPAQRLPNADDTGRSAARWSRRGRADLHAHRAARIARARHRLVGLERTRIAGPTRAGHRRAERIVRTDRRLLPL